MRAIVNMLNSAGKTYGDGLIYNESTNHNALGGALALNDADGGGATGWSFNVVSRLSNRSAANGTQTFYDPNVHIEGWNFTGSHPTPQLSFSGLDNGKIYKITYTADQSSAGTRNADVTVDGTTLTAQGSTAATPADHQAIFTEVGPTAGVIVVDLSNPDSTGWVVAIEIEESAIPDAIITGPATGTEGTNLQSSGTGLDLATSSSLQTTVGGFTRALNITAQTTTTINEDLESGVSSAALGSPASGVPMTPTITAAGITAYQLQHEVTDGVTPSIINFALSAPATHEVIQVMAATSNTTPGESILSSTIITVEDNMQVRVVKVSGGSTFTWSADGTFLVDSSATAVLTVHYFAPSTGQWSEAEITVYESVIISSDLQQQRLSIGMRIGI